MKVVTSISFTEQHAALLEAIQTKRGIPVSVQVRMALTDWFAKHFAVDAEPSDSEQSQQSPRVLVAPRTDA
jgi:hypothetical protein